MRVKDVRFSFPGRGLYGALFFFVLAVAGPGALMLASSGCGGFNGAGFRSAAVPDNGDDFLGAIGTHYWRESVVPYYLENGNDLQRSSTIGALALWNRLPPPVPDFKRVFRPEEAKEGVTVRYVGPDRFPGGSIGHSGGTYRPDGSIERVAITLSDRILPFQLFSLSGHEGGHALGLGEDNPSDPNSRDHSPDEGDLMYGSVPPHKKGLSQRDCNTLYRLYVRARAAQSAPAAPAAPEPPPPAATAAAEETP